MFGGLAAIWPEAPASLPQHFTIIERRLAGTALDAWLQSGGAPVTGFEANSLLIADPGGAAILVGAGAEIAAMFGLVPGMMFDRTPGLTAELCAACHLIALRPEPVPFEACLAPGRRGRVMARGVALPVTIGGEDMVQAVISWREVLNRAASAKLRRELTEALRFSRFSPPIDPFLL